MNIKTKVMLLMLLVPLTGGCEKQKLTVGVLQDISSAPIIYADRNALFEDNIEVILFRSGAERDAALQSGAIDGCISDVLAAAFAINGGFEVSITSRTEGDYALLAAPGSSIESVDDMNGKTVGLSQNTIIDYCVEKFCGGVEIEKVIIKEMPVRVEMLLAKKLDGAAVPQPLAAAAVAGGAKIIANSESLGIDISVLLFGKQSIKNKQKLIENFYDSYNAACRAINNDNTAVEQFVDANIFPETAGKLILPHYKNCALPDRKSYEDCVEWLVNNKLIDKSISWEQATTDRFIKNAGS